MAKDPAVLFYVTDFLNGSSLLTPLQKGHYITLLCYQQQSATGSLTIDVIKKIMGKDFEKHWFILQSKFEADGNGFFNKRMREEVERRKKYSTKQSERVKKRWNNHGNTTVIQRLGNTFLETETEIETVKGGVGEKVFTIEHCQEIALKDLRWIKANHATSKELVDFNKLLEKRGIYEKNPADYKQHFANWKLGGKKEETFRELTTGPKLPIL